MAKYPEHVDLFIDGQWLPAESGRSIPVINPASGNEIGRVAHAGVPDLDKAISAARDGLTKWRNTTALERAKVLRKASAILRSRADDIARLMTQEQGKVVAEAAAEVERTADGNDWLAGEAERIYGRTVASRMPNVTQTVTREPIGIVVAFTPWNFPLFQMVRKTAGALAAGCSIIIKGPEEAPACCAELIRAYEEAGVPPGAVNLVYGTPAEISGYLIPQDDVRKVSFTGSTAVGKQLAALAGQHMKVMTMELGGHAPVIIFDDAGDITAIAQAICMNKFRNAGASCINPSRILVQQAVFDRFVDAFVEQAKTIKVGDGLVSGTTMGPLANARRLEATARLVDDAKANGAELKLGGSRIGSEGNFFEPTVFTNVPRAAAAMNEEPFGPIAMINAFETLEEAVTESNRLPYGLAAFAWTQDPKKARALTSGIESGMISINHFGLGNPEAPFGGVKDSGHGFEGGSEAIEAYLQTRFITTADL